MGRKPCCEKVGLKRGPWTAEEDGKLVSYITNNGICCWRAIPKLAGLLRCGKSCRLRWTNYLRPDLKRGIFSEAEENLILDLHATLGNRWSRIAAQLPGRTDNEIKNYWNTRLKKRLRSQGLDPATHLPLRETLISKQSQGDDDDDNEDEDSSSSDDVASGANSAAKKKSAPGAPKLGAKVRQPKGPKPQLKMCQSKEGPQLVLLTTSPMSPDQQSSGSTVTAEPHGPKLTTAPSFPQAELWKLCVTKPQQQSHDPITAAASELLNEWDSYIGMQNLNCNSQHSANVAVDFVGESTDHFAPEMELDNSWTVMDSVEIMSHSAPESMFAPIINSVSSLNPVESQELQRLATLLDLI